MTARPHPWDLVEWAIRSVPPNNGRCLAVLMALVLHSNAKGTCHPGIPLMAEIVFDVETSTPDQRDRVRRALRWLETEGLVTTLEIPGVGNKYRLTPRRHDEARSDDGPVLMTMPPRSHNVTPRHDRRSPSVVTTGLTTRTTNEEIQDDQAGGAAGASGSALEALKRRAHGS
jgi:hypothetical protein